MPPSVPPAIETGTLDLLGLLPNSSNYTFLARASALGGDEVLAVYKPHRGESPLWDFPEGSLGRREVAAYLVAAALGWPNVPPTVLREGPEGIGSVQLFVPFEPQEHYFTLQGRFPEAFREIAAYDLVVNNADRKGDHVLALADGRRHGVDHGLTFHVEHKLRTVLWGWIGDELDDDETAALRRLRTDLDGDLGVELAGLLTEEARVATIARLETLLGAGRFPAPSGESSAVPWPLF